MRQLSERLPVVQTVPAWMGRTVIQPVAVADTVHYLAEALERPDVAGHLDVVGPDRVTYAELLRTYAAESGLLRIQPGVARPVEAVARVAGAVVDVPSSLVESLIPSLGHDMAADRDAAFVLGVPPDGSCPWQRRSDGHSPTAGRVTTLIDTAVRIQASLIVTMALIVVLQVGTVLHVGTVMQVVMAPRLSMVVQVLRVDAPAAGARSTAQQSVGTR